MSLLATNDSDIDAKIVDDSLNSIITASWETIAPYWPLRNLVAVNPLAGLTDKPFVDALATANLYFQQENADETIALVNRISIKWLQAYFDEGQATIPLPNKERGFYQSIMSLLNYDKAFSQQVSKNHIAIRQYQHKTAHSVIAEQLLLLGIQKEDQQAFLTCALTTLPGWASYIKYKADWDSSHPNLKAEYLAFRLILLGHLMPQASKLLAKTCQQSSTTDFYNKLCDTEADYQQQLISKLDKGQRHEIKAEAQFFFCIDVRSEPMRRAIEQVGAYETFGFAGFFGIPTTIHNPISDDTYSSCPVLVKPSHRVTQSPASSIDKARRRHAQGKLLKSLYTSLKHQFTTPLTLVESMGALSGFWLTLRNFLPGALAFLNESARKALGQDHSNCVDISDISLEQQCRYARDFLHVSGLTKDFAPTVILCGHGSTTQNNAYASALDCGACGGRHGGPNAKVMSAILNSSLVRAHLLQTGIQIPITTRFVAAQHNTTTDEIELFADLKDPTLAKIRLALQQARQINCELRAKSLLPTTKSQHAVKQLQRRALDWAQPRPEWGLAGNASFIIAPRSLSANIDLQGRAFLQSYDWQQDEDGESLREILTAPVVVAHWINAQYLFSTFDNAAFGSGSKVTKNITGKIGVMQGNASDLMHGLSLQSVFKTDKEAYHQCLRLLVVIEAPLQRIQKILQQEATIAKLFANQWLRLVCIDPVADKKYQLTSELSGRKLSA